MPLLRSTTPRSWCGVRACSGVWGRQILIGLVAAPVAAAVALFVLNPGLQDWARERILVGFAP